LAAFAPAAVLPAGMRAGFAATRFAGAALVAAGFADAVLRGAILDCEAVCFFAGVFVCFFAMASSSIKLYNCITKHHGRSSSGRNVAKFGFSNFATFLLRDGEEIW
jgi:hypothetical protein